jgi:AmiR/NasT family two-component response regulator
MSEDGDVRAVVDHARGVLAERFGVAIATADGILRDVALAQGRDITELAAAVVESCTTDSTPLPRTLYTNGEAA